MEGRREGWRVGGMKEEWREGERKIHKLKKG